MLVLRSRKQGRWARVVGFSLVEILVVIAVVAVITAVALPALTPVLLEANATKESRNAQLVVSLYAAARAAGAAVHESDVASAINELAAGVRVTDSANVLDDRVFMLDLAPAERLAVADKLEFANGQLRVK